MSEAIYQRQCWYCGEPAIEVWLTTWSEPGEDWPMCPGCSSSVREALTLRADGHNDDADDVDAESGIATDNICGKWIPPIRSAT